MPPLTAEPLVLVFHSTNKISGAKVKKYTTASEKGLSVYEEIRASTPALAATRSPSSRGTPSGGPSSSKRQRLHPGHTSPGAGVFAGTLPPRKRKRKPARQIDLNRDMFFEDGITSLQEPEWPSDSEQASSAASSLTPPPPAPKAMSPFIDPPSPEDLEYGRNFTSYYILDDDDDNGKKTSTAPPVKAPKPSKKPDVPRQQPHPQPPRNGPYPPPPQAHTSRAPRQRSSTNRPLPAPAPQPVLPILPPPRVTIVDNIKRDANPDKRYAVDEMIAKLDVLSLALIKFGAVPPAKESVAPAKPPPPNSTCQPDRVVNRTNYLAYSVANSINGGPARSAATAQADESVNGLLAMFDDDGDSDALDEDEDVEAGSAQSSKDADTDLSVTGTADADLHYGIQFIMNALMTWAKQRIDAMYTQQWQQYNEVTRLQQQQQHVQTKKGRGRPKTNEVNHGSSISQPPAPPAVVNAELTNTPEGEAVQAFQDVVDCGVLKVNGLMPKELTRALGVLYVQIDHLINNSTSEKPRWQCMSYHAQIKAHNMKVQRWKEQAVRMQEEMSRQQELAHQQMMQQMAVPRRSQHPDSMSDERAFRHRDMAEELRRHQSQSTRDLATPMDLDTLTPGTARPSIPAVPAYDGVSRSLWPPSSTATHHPPHVTIQASDSRLRDAMSRVTMYHDGRPANVAPEHQAQLQMRSGQGMKFSFDHSNEAARQLFGQSAFPSAADHASSIPRRGPMARPSEAPFASHGANGHLPTPVLGSNAPSLSESAEPGKAGKSKAKAPSSTDEVSITKVNGVKNPIRHTDGEIEVLSKPRKASDMSASPVIKSSEQNGGKRKHSEARPASASPSTAPTNSAKHTLRLGRTRRSTAHAASSAEEAVVVKD